MSQENVEIARRWNAAYNRRDHDSLRELTHPEFEFRTIFLTVESVFRGHEGLDAYFEAIEDAYERFVVPVDEYIDAGAAVLVFAHAEWRGKESGAEGTMPLAVAAWLRAGKVVRIETSPTAAKRSKPWGCRSRTPRVTGPIPGRPASRDLRRHPGFWACWIPVPVSLSRARQPGPDRPRGGRRCPRV